MRPSMRRVTWSTTTSRRGRTRSATVRKPSLLTRPDPGPVPPLPPAPQAKGATYFGGRTASNTLAPTPITVPVASSVPMAVFAWSPIRLPRNCRPLSSGVPPTSRRTGPYVFFRFDVMVPAPRLAQRPITECPTNPSCALLAYPRKTQEASSPRTLQCGPIADPLIGPPRSCVFTPAQSGPVRRAPDATCTPASSTIEPPRVSNTVPGSTTAPRNPSRPGSPSTVLPRGTGSLSPSRAPRSSPNSCSSAGMRSYAPCSTRPATSTAGACATGPSHCAPAPTPQPTVTPRQVSRNAPSGGGESAPRGANVDDPMIAGPVTGCRATTVGTPGSTNPARWGSARISAVSTPTNVSHRSRTRCAPARSSERGRAPANGAQAADGSGSSRYRARVTAAAPAPSGAPRG